MKRDREANPGEDRPPCLLITLAADVFGVHNGSCYIMIYYKQVFPQKSIIVKCEYQ